MNQPKFVKKHARNSSLPAAFFSTLLAGKKTSTSPLVGQTAPPDGATPALSGIALTSVNLQNMSGTQSSQATQQIGQSEIPTIATTHAETPVKGKKPEGHSVASSPAPRGRGVASGAGPSASAMAAPTGGGGSGHIAVETAQRAATLAGVTHNKQKLGHHADGVVVTSGSSSNENPASMSVQTHADENIEISGPIDDTLQSADQSLLSMGLEDRPDGAPLEDDGQLRSSRKHLNKKIKDIMEKMKQEQASKEENVNEYLRLARNADKQQLVRIKSVFEKKNNTLTQNIAALQRKLNAYEARLEALGTTGGNGSSSGGGHHRPRHVFKDMGQGLKGVVDSVRGAKDTIVSKPKEFASKLKNKFGSADNITALKNEDESADENEADRQSHASDSHNHRASGSRQSEGDEAASVASSSSHPGSSARDGGRGGGGGGGAHSTGAHSSPAYILTGAPHQHLHTAAAAAGMKNHTSQRRAAAAFNAQHTQSGSESADVLSGNDLSSMRSRAGGVSGLLELSEAIHRLSEQQHQLQHAMDAIRVHHDEQTAALKQLLEEERYRAKCLEEQINDLSDLHQHEVTNIKQELQSMEEKMEYQLEERTRDMQELLESCQTRVTKMELQQQQQQLISMEAFENSNFRNLVTKLINVVLAVLAVILVLVSTVASIIGPFIYSRFRVVSTIVLAVALAMLWKNWGNVEPWLTHFSNTYLSPWLPWTNR